MHIAKEICLGLFCSIFMAGLKRGRDGRNGGDGLSRLWRFLICQRNAGRQASQMPAMGTSTRICSVLRLLVPTWVRSALCFGVHTDSRDIHTVSVLLCKRAFMSSSSACRRDSPPGESRSFPRASRGAGVESPAMVVMPVGWGTG